MTKTTNNNTSSDTKISNHNNNNTNHIFFHCRCNVKIVFSNTIIRQYLWKIFSYSTVMMKNKRTQFISSKNYANTLSSKSKYTVIFLTTFFLKYIQWLSFKIVLKYHPHKNRVNLQNITWQSYLISHKKVKY